MLVLEPSAADVARKPRLDTALHPLVEVQRLPPFVRLAAVVAQVAGPKDENRQA